jgi:ribonuclease BN (tRNA processing enzyme)
VLGSGGWLPNGERETACTLVREDDRALVLDAGTGLRRLLAEPGLLDGVRSLDVVLTHFHLDHVCGLGYVPALPIVPTLWAPGRWLYGRASAEILAPLREPPLSPFTHAQLGAVRELGEAQSIGGFGVTARAQERHWDPTAGLRVGDLLALCTDTAYDSGSGPFACGVAHLLHEAWSLDGAEGDASAAEAGRVAREAGPGMLTLIHFDPLLRDADALLAAACAEFERTRLGHDGLRLA